MVQKDLTTAVSLLMAEVKTLSTNSASRMDKSNNHSTEDREQSVIEQNQSRERAFSSFREELRQTMERNTEHHHGKVRKIDFPVFFWG